MLKPAKSKLLYQLLFKGGGWPTSVAYLGSGRRLAAANQYGQIYLWELPEKPPEYKPDPKSRNARQAPDVAPVRRLDGHTNEISHILALPDGKTLISASYDHTIRIWPTDAASTGKAEVRLDENPDIRGNRKQTEQSSAIPVETQTTCEVLEAHREWIYALGLSGDGKRLISGDAASQVIVWDVATRKPISKWTGLPWNWIIAASLSADGSRAVVSEQSYKRDDFDIPPPALIIRDAATGKETLDLLKVLVPKYGPNVRTYESSQHWRKFVGAGLITTAFSPDGKYIAAGQGGETGTGKVHLIDADTGKLVRDVAGHQEGVTAVRFSADGKYLISTGRDTTARICQVSDGKEVAVLGTGRGGQFKDWFHAVTLSPDERFLAVADIAGMVQVWEFEG